MKSKSSVLQNFISTTVYGRAGFLENGQVVDDAVGEFDLSEVVAPAGSACISETDIVVVKRGKSRRQIYLDGDLAKRKYEDMTSSRIEDVVKAGDDHEVSCKLSYFREHKKRRPPEAAGNLLQVLQETTPVHVEGGALGGEEELLQTRTRSHSASGVLEVTPEICGESDLTAENHMAEESSRSSNNDGSSTMFDSAAESVSKGSNREFRSVSSLGIMHCFLDHSTGNASRDVSMLTSSEGPSHMSSLLVKNDAHNIYRTGEVKDVQDRDSGVSKSEPAASLNQLGAGSTVGAPSSAANNPAPSQLWERTNQEWLQLGVGSSGRGAPASSNVHSEPASVEDLLGKSLQSFGQGHQERPFFKRKISTSIDFPIAASSDYEALDSNIFPENSNANATVLDERCQFRRGLSNVIPPKCEASTSTDPAVNLNPATFRSVPISSLNIMKNAAAASETVGEVEKQDLCIFGRRLIQTGTARQELVLAPLSGSVTRKSCSNASEKDSLATASIDERFNNMAGLRRSEIHNRAGPPFSSISAPSMDVPLRSARAAAAAGTSMDHSDPFQCHRDNPPSSLSALQQRREDLRQGQVGYSWLPPPAAAESAPKLVPMANNFQGWNSSELPSTALRANNNAAMDNPLDPQATRGSDEWGSLFRKVSPKMVFQSQCHVPEGSGSVLVQSADQETSVGGSQEKRAIENMRRPQWPIPPEAMNLSVASWCLNANLQGVRGDSKAECFAGERSLMSSILSESGPAHSRFAGDHLNLSEKPPQRQSWQPAAGHTRLHHGNVNSLQRPSPETAGKTKFQVIPPGSRGTNHAGLWFVLQSAENQLRILTEVTCYDSLLLDSTILLLYRNGEGGLPQISKAYLRIKDGKMPVSAVKKYLVTKLGLTSESEVEITCKGQPVVPSLPLLHVRDVIWFSSLNANNNSNNNNNNKEQTSSGDREEPTTSASEQRSRPPPASDRATTTAAGMFSKEILMVLTYRRHPRSLQLSTLLT